MSRREAVLLSVFLHGGLILLFLFGPRLPFIREYLAQAAEQQRLQQEQQMALQQQQQQQRPRFVFVQPKTIADLADFMAGRVLSLLRIEHQLYPAWDPKADGE